MQLYIDTLVILAYVLSAIDAVIISVVFIKIVKNIFLCVFKQDATEFCLLDSFSIEPD